MDGRWPNSITVWAGDEAMPQPIYRQLIDSGFYRAGSRWQGDHQRGGPKSPKHLVILETSRREAHRAWEQASEGLDVGGSLVLSFNYRMSEPELDLAEPGRRSKGLMVALSDCTDLEREDEFHRWYDGTHAADVLRSGLYQGARRFQRSEADAAEFRFLCLYETQGSEPETMQAVVARPELGPSSVSPLCRLRRVWTYNRVGSATPA